MTLRRKLIPFFVIFAGFIFIAGCQTTKNIAQAVPPIAEGLSADVKNTSVNIWKAIIRADNWVKENLW